jgi:hypothetical protein
MSRNSRMRFEQARVDALLNGELVTRPDGKVLPAWLVNERTAGMYTRPNIPQGTVEVSFNRSFVVICGMHGVVLTENEAGLLRVKHPKQDALAVWQFNASSMQCPKAPLGKSCKEYWYLGFEKEDA